MGDFGPTALPTSGIVAGLNSVVSQGAGQTSALVSQTSPQGAISSGQAAAVPRTGVAPRATMTTGQAKIR